MDTCSCGNSISEDYPDTKMCDGCLECGNCGELVDMKYPENGMCFSCAIGEARGI